MWLASTCPSRAINLTSWALSVPPGESRSPSLRMALPPSSALSREPEELRRRGVGALSGGASEGLVCSSDSAIDVSEKNVLPSSEEPSLPSSELPSESGRFDQLDAERFAEGVADGVADGVFDE